MVTVIYTKAEFETSSNAEIIYNDSAKSKTGQRYNLMGQPVGNDYKGIIVEDRKKLIVR